MSDKREAVANAIEAGRSLAGVPSSVDLSQFANLAEMFQHCVDTASNNPAVSCLGYTLNYSDLDRLSANFASYLQNELGMKAGDRIAIQMPNILQYPVVLFAAIRAGLVVVNTNPLYSERELEHQIKDSGAKVMVVLANIAEVAAAVAPMAGIETVIVTELADLHPPVKRLLILSLIHI